MSFREFVLEGDHKNGTYVSVKLDNDSSNKLFSWISNEGITNPTPKKEYHCTLVYSRKGIPEAKTESLNLPINASVTGWDLFPTQDGKNCLVARLSAKDLEAAHDMYRTKYGATYDYDEYKPHVTVSYDFDGKTPENVPNFTFKFDRHEFKSLDPDWKAE